MAVGAGKLCILGGCTELPHASEQMDTFVSKLKSEPVANK